MSSIKKIRISILSFLLFLVSCTPKNDMTPKTVENSTYAVSLSKTMYPESKVVFLSDNGDVIGSKKYNGNSIYTINKWDEDIYLHSSRKNEHFKLSKNGVFQEFKLSLNNVQHPGYGVWVVEKGKQSLIESVNGGFNDDAEYQSGIVYTKNSDRVSISLKNQTISGVTEKDNKIFVSTVDQKLETSKLVIVNRNSDTIDKELALKKTYYVRSGVMHFIHDKLVSYGDNKGFFNYSNKNNSGVIAISLIDYSYRTFDLPDEELIEFMYTYDSKIFVVTNSGKLYVLSEDMHLIEDKKIEQQHILKIIKYDESFFIKKVINDGDLIHVVKRNLDFGNPDNIGDIYVVRKKDLSLIKEVNLNIKNNNVWYDAFDITLIK
ncbi:MULTISPECIES: hypothetical protein [Terrabacteria group]|uniref:hypothetical protein n=1 Tax=Bacillati TaxID=1783272 RepID=UPI001C6E0564|nr:MULTISPECIES: hypothetical protein [Terrabacteria group]MBW9212872.1 hypothetical protein [Trueperella sp. zg.1013]